MAPGLEVHGLEAATQLLATGVAMMAMDMAVVMAVMVMETVMGGRATGEILPGVPLRLAEVPFSQSGPSGLASRAVCQS